MIYLSSIFIAVVIGAFYYFYLRRAVATSGLLDVKARNVNAAIIIFAAILAGLGCSYGTLGGIFAAHLAMLALIFRFIDYIVKKIAAKRRGDKKALRKPAPAPPLCESVDRRRQMKGRRTAWQRIYGSGIVPLVVTCALMLYGYFNMLNVVRTDYTVYTDKNIRAEGYSVALISDVHFGVLMTEDELKGVCATITKENYDIVVLCGDIVDEYSTKENMHAVFRAFGGIKSTFGIFYVYGNHDRQHEGIDRVFTERELADAITENGIKILDDEVYRVNDELALVGRADKTESGGERGRTPIAELTKDIDDNAYVITLDHQPMQYKENGEAKTNRLLSGHTHNGQLWPLGTLFGWASVNESMYGLTKINDSTDAIVSSGFAGWGYPIRTSGHAEYVAVKILPRSK